MNDGVYSFPHGSHVLIAGYLAPRIKARAGTIFFSSNPVEHERHSGVPSKGSSEFIVESTYIAIREVLSPLCKRLSASDSIFGELAALEIPCACMIFPIVSFIELKDHSITPNNPPPLYGP